MPTKAPIKPRWTAEIRDVLADRKNHSLDEIVDTVGTTVPAKVALDRFSIYTSDASARTKKATTEAARRYVIGHALRNMINAGSVIGKKDKTGKYVAYRKAPKKKA